MNKKRLMTGIVLTCGLDKRFEQNRHVGNLQEKTLIKRAFDLLFDYCNEIIISENDSEMDECDIITADGIYQGTSPLGCVYNVLNYSKSSKNIIISCNMPFLNHSMIEALIDLENEFYEGNIDSSKLIFCFSEGLGSIFPFPFIIDKSMRDEIKQDLSCNKTNVKDFINSHNHISYRLNDNQVKNMREINTPDSIQLYK